MRLQLYALGFSLIFLFSACQHEPIVIEEPSAPIPDLTFLSHTQMDGQGEINPQLYLKDWKKEGVLLLGGDLDEATSFDEMTIMAYDDLFDFGNPSTYWAIGNHDTKNIPLMLSFTERGRFHTAQEGNVTLFMVDTQLDGGDVLGEQLALFQTVTDTLSASKTFIYLTHKLIWMPGNDDLEPELDSLPNGGSGTCLYCTPESNFYEVIYPKLVELAQSGIQVICLAGDLGEKRKYFEYETAEGITYMANGWNKDDPENTFLEFFYTENGQLRWEQVRIEQ